VTPTLREPRAVGDLVEWGAVPDMIEGQSTTSGVILHKGAEGESECGIWVCTPGTWHCHVTSDEFCHFLEGRCTYTRETGPGEPDEVIEIEPDTAAFFDAGWKGTCRVEETIRKVYMIR
jgi:uncharacterized cupin superfamily protein